MNETHAPTLAELRAENDARLARLMAQFDKIDAMIAAINKALGGKKNAPSDK